MSPVSKIYYVVAGEVADDVALEWTSDSCRISNMAFWYQRDFPSPSNFRAATAMIDDKMVRSKSKYFMLCC